MKFQLSHWQQRLNDQELKLCREFIHNLDKEERDKRRIIMWRETRRDLSWGFFDETIWGFVRRTFYKVFVHRWLTKQASEIEE